jgi:hypothetical protein
MTVVGRLLMAYARMALWFKLYTSTYSSIQRPATLFSVLQRCQLQRNIIDMQ